MSELIDSIKREFNLSEEETDILGEAFHEIYNLRYKEVFMQERDALCTLHLLPLLNTLSKDRAVPYTDKEIKSIVMREDFFFHEVDAYARIKATVQSDKFTAKFDKVTLAAWSESEDSARVAAW